MNLAFIRITAFLFISLLFSGCLVVKEKATVPSARSFFAGVVKATNLGGAIRVSWNAPTEPISKYNIYLVSATGDLSFLDSVDANKTSYTHASGLEKTKIYSYVVKAVDTSGSEDANKVIAASFLFGGIVNVSITGRTTANISLPGDSGAFDKIRIYGLPMGGITKKLIKEVDRGTYSVDLTSLRPGVTYNFSASAYNSSLSQEDGNELTISERTQSYSFDGTDYRYRGLMSVMAFGNSPNAPYDTTDPKRVPKDRLVRLTYLPFSSTTGATKYKIVRTLKGAKLDMSTTTACTPTTDTSCWVCDNWAGPDTCDDFNIAPPPKRYDYAISQYFTDGTDSWIEELPETNSEFRVTVAVPPKNMVLVNRDAANYEMCDLMGQSSDPKNHQRCPYTGIGASPYNSGPERPTPLNLAYGYYDFGYSLFVDRWELACNWTRSADGGKCGAGGTDGDCFRYTDPVAPSTAPPANIGVNGNVLFQIGNADSSACWVKISGSWSRADAINSLGAATLASLKVATSDPSPAKTLGPIEHLFGPENANNPTNLCASMTTEYNLPKRIMRMREWRAAAAWPRFYKEPYAMSVSAAADIENMSSYAPGGCVSNSISSGNLSNPNLAGKIASSFNDLLTGNFEFLFYRDGANNIYGRTRVGIGSKQSSKCLSRYGVQDMIGNTTEIVSDIVTCNVSNDCVYSQNANDTGNKDLQGVNFDGATVFMPDTPGAFAYTNPTWSAPSNAIVMASVRLVPFSGTYNATGVAAPTAGAGPNFAAIPYVNPTLGLPLMQSDFGNAIPINSFKLSSSADGIFSWRNENTVLSHGFALGGYQSGERAGRWYTDTDRAAGQHTTRCAHSAE